MRKTRFSKKNGGSDPFYDSGRWRTLRQSILIRDKYMCQLSWRYGKMIPADVVHHIFPREEYPEYQWEPWNLISISNKAHEALHDRTNGRLTQEGVDLMMRTARKNNIKI